MRGRPRPPRPGADGRARGRATTATASASSIGDGGVARRQLAHLVALAGVGVAEGACLAVVVRRGRAVPVDLAHVLGGGVVLRPEVPQPDGAEPWRVVE